MTEDRSTAASIACEMFKAVRCQWMSREEMAEHTGLHAATVRRWVDEYTAHGIFVSRTRPRDPDGSGRGPVEVALAPEWGGVGS